MSSFKKNDRIQHPTHGNGEIMEVTKVNDSLSILDVDFPANGVRKQLSSLWVQKNCQHIPYTPPEKPQFRNGEYITDPALSTDVWTVCTEKNTPMPDGIQRSLQFLLSHILPGVNFVLIGLYSAVVLLPEEGTTDRQIEQAAKKHMVGVFRQHPDFGAFENDDKSVVVTMRDDHLCIFLPPDQVDRKADGSLSLKTLLAGREILLSACADKKMYAIVRSAPTA